MYISSLFLAAKTAIWQPQRDTLHIFENIELRNGMTCIRLVLQKCFEYVDKKTVSYFLGSISKKSSKHCHFIRQIDSSRNHLVPNLSNFRNPKFLRSD